MVIFDIYLLRVEFFIIFGINVIGCVWEMKLIIDVNVVIIDIVLMFLLIVVLIIFIVMFIWINIK